AWHSYSSRFCWSELCPLVGYATGSAAATLADSRATTIHTQHEPRMRRPPLRCAPFRARPLILSLGESRTCCGRLRLAGDETQSLTLPVRHMAGDAGTAFPRRRDCRAG